MNKYPKDIYNLIQIIPAAKAAYDAADDSLVVTELNNSYIVKTNSKRRNANWITLNLTPSEARQVFDSLQSSSDPLVKMALMSLSNEGIDMSNDIVQSMIPDIGISWSPGLVDKVLKWGKWTISPVEDMWAIGESVTLSDITNVRTFMTLNDRMNTNIILAETAIEKGEVSTWADVVTILGT